MRAKITAVEEKMSKKQTPYYAVTIEGSTDALFGFDKKFPELVGQEVDVEVKESEGYKRIDLTKEKEPKSKGVITEVQPPASLPAEVYVRMHALDIATRIRDMADVPAEKVGSERLLYIADKMYNYIMSKK